MAMSCLWRRLGTASQWRSLLFPRTTHIPQIHVERLASSQARAKERLPRGPVLSSSEALGALSPFYLAVHPDLFTRFPQEKATNEESLKLLNSYLDALESSQRPQPLSLTFYIHHTVSGVTALNGLRTVAVSLDSLSVGSAVYDILGSCDLSGYLTEDVRTKLVEIKEHDKLQRTTSNDRTPTQSTLEKRDWEKEWDNVFSSKSRDRRGGTPTYLDKWLSENLSRARERLEASHPIRKENKSIIQGLCSKFNIQSIAANPDWMAATLRGHLQNLKKSLECQRNSLTSDLDPGAALVLGYDHGVDVSGRIFLNCEETVQQWVQARLASAIDSQLKLAPKRVLIPSLVPRPPLTAFFAAVTWTKSNAFFHGCEKSSEKRPGYEANSSPGHEDVWPGDKATKRMYFLPFALHLVLKSQETLGPMERELSASMGGVSFQRPSDGDVSLDAYAHWLESCLGYCRQQPIAVGSDAFRGRLVMLSRPDKSPLPSIGETGAVHVPVSCSPRHLVEFLQESRHRLERVKRECERQQNTAAESLMECQTALRLGSLTRTPTVSDAQFCRCCSRLFQRLAHSDGSEYAELRDGLAGHHLNISTYFSVSSDGKLRVPWNFDLQPHGSASIT